MKIKINDITGTILAGGQSTRMGQDKSLLTLNGKSFIQRIAEELQKIFTRVIVISDNANGYNFLHLPVYSDFYKDCGPLSGIHSSFQNTKTQKVLVLTCDMPLIDVPTLLPLLNAPPDCDANVFSSDDFILPFPGLYRRSCLSLLENHLQQKKCSVIGFLRALKVHINPIVIKPSTEEATTFAHINNPSDYLALCKEFK